jgi:hypothetical protein
LSTSSQVPAPTKKLASSGTNTTPPVARGHFLS